MEVMETIVIQSAEVEGKDKAASVADTEKTKAGEFKRSLLVGSFHLYCSMQGKPDGGAAAVRPSGNTDSFNSNQIKEADLL